MSAARRHADPPPPAAEFRRFVAITRRLRRECPWDRKQTHRSLGESLLEETYEVLDTLGRRNTRDLAQELGDLLLHVAMQATIAEEKREFTFAEVITGISDKLVRRHPHVFGDTEVSGSADVLRNWARIKADERRDREDRSTVAGVPRAMPALLRAHRLSEKASRVGFDWEQASDVLEKVEEELSELRAAVELGERAEVEAELGDVLFALTSLGRHLDIQAEDALQRASDRFIRRFRYIEARLAERQQHVHDASVDEMNLLWEEAKTRA